MADDFDWCARASKLREVESALLAGEMVTEARFGSNMTKWAGAPLAEVRAAIDYATQQCAIQNGEKPKRTRYAISVRARPY